MGLLGCCGFLAIVLIIFMTIGLVAFRIQLFQLRSFAKRFPCANCGTILGIKSLELADTEWERQLEEMRREHSDVKFKIVRTLHAICANCGTKYRFVKKDRTFVLYEAD